jgi:peptide chain release factor subunit 1
MITREELRELAQFQSPEGGCAVSFYFQPRTPQNRSHREEAILAKDLVRKALHELEKSGRNGCRADLDRILAVAGGLHGNQARAKAIFACSKKNLWREFDLPPQLRTTELVLKPQFYLRPMAHLLGAQPRLCVVLVDRQRARFFDLRLDELKEREGMFGTLPRRGRSDGFAGYEGGHAERRVADEALHHFKKIAERLKDELDKGAWQNLIVGSHSALWPELEKHLHTYVKQRVLGHFVVDPASASPDKIRERATRIFQDETRKRRESLLSAVISHARSHRRGALGLRRVLRSLELGEVQTLLLSENFTAAAVECTGCGHLDSHVVSFCPLCGRATRELEDVSDAVVASAIRRDIEMFYVPPGDEMESLGNIAALLRFRSDQSKSARLAS